jgi:hypothetical protein
VSAEAPLLARENLLDPVLLLPGERCADNRAARAAEEVGDLIGVAALYQSEDGRVARLYRRGYFIDEVLGQTEVLAQGEDSPHRES